jgi:hypothetical protein
MQPRLLPLIAAMVAASGAQAGSLALMNAPVPTNDLDKRSILTSQFALIDGKKVAVKYNTIMRSGDLPGRRLPDPADAGHSRTIAALDRVCAGRAPEHA